MIKLDSILKSRNLANKGPHSQSYGFFSSHVWRWEMDHKESWALKNRCFRIVVLEKTPESPLTAWRSNQSVPKKTNPEYWLEGLMLKLKLQYFGHLMQRADSWKRPWCWERLRAGEGGGGGWDGWIASLTQWTWVWANSRRWWRTGKSGVLQSMGSRSRTQLSY